MKVPKLGEYRYPYPSKKNHRAELSVSKGVIIEVEGIDGSGKSTQVARLKEYLESKNYCVYTGNFIHSQYLHNILLQTKYENCDEYTSILMYTMGLSYFFTEEIANKLNENYVVILDRYIVTLLGKGLVRNVDRQWLNNLVSIFRPADIQIFIDADPQNCIRRKLQQSPVLSYWECGCELVNDDSLRDSYQKEKYELNFLTYQKAVREIMLQELGDRSIIVKGDSDCEEIHAAITQRVEEMLQQFYILQKVSDKEYI